MGLVCRVIANVECTVVTGLHVSTLKLHLAASELWCWTTSHFKPSAVLRCFKPNYSMTERKHDRLDTVCFLFRRSNVCRYPYLWSIIESCRMFCQDDFADNKEFITVLVYKNEGRRVFYPCEWHSMAVFSRQETIYIDVLDDIRPYYVTSLEHWNACSCYSVLIHGLNDFF